MEKPIRRLLVCVCTIVCYLIGRISKVGLDVNELSVVDSDTTVHHLCHVSLLLTVHVEDEIGGEEYVRGINVDLSL